MTVMKNLPMDAVPMSAAFVVAAVQATVAVAAAAAAEPVLVFAHY